MASVCFNTPSQAQVCSLFTRDHPNARGQKRYIDEKGPFGKSNRRKGSSRTRTATPAKRENPTVDAFTQALNYDLKKNANSSSDTPASQRAQTDANLTSRAPSMTRVPTQCIIYGYRDNSQWLALDTFERISYGMICEDYARTPPTELRRYPNYLSASPRARRPLTPEERHLAFRFDGGNHWVKVTFDSAEAAERAVETSPSQIYGHWVYCDYWRGTGPEEDAPILVTEEEQQTGRPARRTPATIGPSFGLPANTAQRLPSATLPRNFNANALQNGDQQTPEAGPSSSPTASSGTATAPEYPDLRRRNLASAEENRLSQTQPQSSSTQHAQTHNPQMMRFFPDTPRTVLRPASEAFLPIPSWWERQLQWLRDHHLIPGEIIGNGIPRRENGEPDIAAASFYWKFFYWIDSTFGTDFCGLRPEEGEDEVL